MTLDRGGFFRSVLVLVSGTALAHGITALVMPVLSRLYTPEDFGALNAFTSTLSILGVAACLRYELAIALPQDEEDARSLLGLSLLICTVLSALAALVIYLFSDSLSRFLSSAGVTPFLWLMPPAIWLMGAYSALQFWYVRNRRFGALARTRVAQSAVAAGTQVAMGWWAASGPAGLMIGWVLNAGAACVAMGGDIIRCARTWSWRRIAAVANTYRRFPLFSTGEALANSAAVYLPPLFIASLAGKADAGQLQMAMTVAQAPLSMLGTALSQVYLSEAAEHWRRSTLPDFTLSVLGKLISAGAGPVLAGGILAPQLLAPIMGQPWERAGWIVAWLTPWFLMQFLAVPVAMALHVTGHQRRAMALQAGGLLLRVGVVLAVARWSPEYMVEAFALTGFVFYAIYLAVVMASVGITPRQLCQTTVQSAKKPIIWSASALAVVLAKGLMLP